MARVRNSSSGKRRRITGILQVDHPQTSKKPTNSQSKRKRGQDVENPSPQSQGPPSPKRLQTSHGAADGLPLEPERDTSTGFDDLIKNWIPNKRWPSVWFKQGSQIGENFFERDSWLEEQMARPPPPTDQYVEINGRKRSDSNLTGSSDQMKRENKSAKYLDTRYATLLAAKGSYMEKSDLGITNTSLSSYKSLLSLDQTIPNDSLFRDDLFEATCRSVLDRKQA
ncbi:hypothetical protein MMC15_008175 [Xylographa vitiligo]|nr:hypothetical protein [Xylographa vitiligo]